MLTYISGILDILHKLEIVHADLKPDNFLMLHTPGTQVIILASHWSILIT